MDLLEYQAKELFREMGIPVLPSQRIDHTGDLKRLQIPYPVVLKSQVRAGGRGRVGGVRFAENTIDAIAAAQAIFNLPILGEYPQVLLAEAKYDVTREFYLAVTLDYNARRPVLLGSSQGGMNVEAVMEQMQQVIVEEEFSPFYARRLAVKMGLKGNLIGSVSCILEKMYQLFVQKDLDGLEINPLGVSSTGEVMALDGKITVNDAAFNRHPDLAMLAAEMPESEMTKETPLETYNNTSQSSLNWVNRDGNIGILCNGSDLAIAIADLVTRAGGSPRLCLSVSEEASGDLSAASRGEKLEQELERFVQNKNIKVLLVNIVGSAAVNEEVASSIVNYLQRKVNDIPEVPSQATRRFRPRGSDRRYEQKSLPQFIVRLLGSEIDYSSEHFASMPVNWIDNLEDAIAQAVSLAKSTAKT